MSAETQGGLRERKKQRTRETIIEVALGLFAENGFQQTTIAQIAEAADVSPRTVSTYFPAKEEIVFEITGESKRRLAESIRGRPAGTDTMDALREWVLSEREIWNENHDQFTCQRQVIKSDDGLMTHERARLREFEQVMAEGLAVDLGLSPDAMEPRMAAAAAVAMFDMLGEEGETGEGGAIPEMEDQLRLLDQALTFINGGVRAMREAGGNGTP